MNIETLRTSVLNSIVDFLNDKPDGLVPESRLVEDLGLDSTEMVDIFVDLEKKLGICLKDVKFANLNTINDLIKVVSSRIPGLAI